MNLHETTLKFIILLKKAQVHEALAIEVNKDLEFIKQAQQTIHQSDHYIKILRVEEIRHKRMEIKYWMEISEVSKNKIEYIYLKRKKIWDLVNEYLQKLDLPTFSIFDNFVG